MYVAPIRLMLKARAHDAFATNTWVPHGHARTHAQTRMFVAHAPLDTRMPSVQFICSPPRHHRVIGLRGHVRSLIVTGHACIIEIARQIASRAAPEQPTDSGLNEHELRVLYAG